jgi:hypothetical protein
VRPLMKKLNLNTNNPASYQSISNLSFIPSDLYLRIPYICIMIV